MYASPTNLNGPHRVKTQQVSRLESLQQLFAKSIQVIVGNITGLGTRDGSRVWVRGVRAGVAKLRPSTNPYPQDGGMTKRVLMVLFYNNRIVG